MHAISCDVIKQIYDPYAGRTIIKGEPYTPNPTDVPQGAIIAAIEYLGEHGFIICPVYAVFTDALLNMAEVQEKVLAGAKIKQQINGKWELQIQGENGACELCFMLDTAELLKVFTRDNITLYAYSEALIVIDEDSPEIQSDENQNNDEQSTNTAQEKEIQENLSKEEIVKEEVGEEQEEVFEDEGDIAENIEEDLPQYGGDWQDDEQNDTQDIENFSDLEDIQVPTDDDAPPF